MESNNNYNLLAIDLDMCGKTDEPIKKGQCSGCKHYKGFELYNAKPCVKCSYYIDD